MSSKIEIIAGMGMIVSAILRKEMRWSSSVLIEIYISRLLNGPCLCLTGEVVAKRQGLC